MALYDEIMKPANLGLFGLAGGLLEAGGPSKMPVSLGQGLNRGFLQGTGLAQGREGFLQHKAFEEEKAKFMQQQALMEQLKLLQSMQPKPAEPYTLAAGARRFGPDNQPVAENPKPEGPIGPQSDLGKLAEDFRAGRISQKEYDEKYKKLVHIQPPAQVNVPINLAENKYATTVGGKAGERDVTQHDAAMQAVEGIAKTGELLRHLKQSDAITGLGAEVFTNIQRAKQLVLNDQKAGKQVSDTQILDAFLGSDVFPMIGALGIGARGLDTPAEREYLRKVMTGTIEMDKNALIKLTKIRNDIGRRMVKRWNQRVERGELDDYFKYAQTPKQKIDLPPDADAEDWISRAMRANMVNREAAIKEGKRLGKVPEDY